MLHAVFYNSQFFSRWRKCLEAGMSPLYVKSAPPGPQGRERPLPLSDLVLSLHRSTVLPVPALYLGRQHARNVMTCVATSLPSSSDLSAEGAGRALAFLAGLPGFSDWTADQRAHAAGPGAVQLMLVRFLARYRPEVRAFLLPSGQFVFPAQLDLPGPLVAGLT